MRIHVALQERIFVYEDNIPTKYIGPGRHRIFRPLKKLAVVRKNVDRIVADLRPEEAALVPASDLTSLKLGVHERALVMVKGRPFTWLGEGEHQVWTVDPSVEIKTFDVSGVEVAPLVESVKAVVPDRDYTEVTAPKNSAVIRFVDGDIHEVLAPGRHAAWKSRQKVEFLILDLRERLLHVNGQEVMTKDRVTLRLNLSVAFRVLDPVRVATVAREADDVLYLAVQFAARETVATRTLDQLLVERDAIAETISPEVRARAEAVGLAIVTFGVKDVILPGEMKTLLNRVIEAQKEAEANVILRREETAAVRSMANTAKVMAENPVILRLKELEAYKELAAKVDKVQVVVGNGTLPKLNLLT